MLTSHTITFNRIFTPISFLYGIGVKFRNQLFDWNILKSVSYDLPIQRIGRSGKNIGTWRDESLFVKFFNPLLDEPTVKVAEDLKKKGYRVVCGTDVLPGHFRYHNEHHQYDVFDRVYPSLEMHLKKPDPAFFRYIAESEGVEPDEMFFSDDFTWNIEAAGKLGITTHLYRNADELRKALVDLGLL